MPFYTYYLSVFLCLWLSQTGLYAQDSRRIGIDYEHTYPHYGPVLSPSGSFLLYSEDKNEANLGRENLADIWICQHLGDNQWSRPVNAGIPLNSDLADQCLAVNLDENELFLLIENEQGKKSIAQSTLNNRTWSIPQVMRIEPWDSLFQIQHGFVSNDGQTLLLCLFHPDSSRQQSNIYVAQRESDLSWKNLQSLGTVINTNGQERSAFLAADGQTLYFSSNGHKGFGGFDLFVARRTTNSWTEWSTPVNLGATFNSSNDDWGFTTSVLGEKAWWSTAEKNLQSIRTASIPDGLRPQHVILVKGLVYQPLSKTVAPSVNVTLNYFDLLRGKKVTRQGITNQQGKYQLLLPRNSEMTISGLTDVYYSPTYNLLGKGPAAIEREDNESELMKVIKIKAPAYQQVESEIETLQLAINEKSNEIRTLDKERIKYIDAILHLQDDTIPGDLSAKSSELGLKKLKEEYDAAQKQQALLFFHDEPKRDANAELPLGGLPNASPRAIPTDFDDFVRIIEIQQRWEILPATTQSLIRQMLLEEIKKKDKEISSADRILWRSEKDSILNKPSLLLLPETALSRWKGVFTPCFEWQEIFCRDLSNMFLQKNQSELTSLIKNDVRNYLRAFLNYRLSLAQSNNLKKIVREKVEAQLQFEREHLGEFTDYRTKEEPALPIDTLTVIAKNELDQDIQLFDPLIEKTIVLDDIVFLANQAELDSSSYAEINRLAAFLRANPNLIIEIVAHTNNHCTYNFAADLTARRAEKIADLLITSPLEAERIRHRGMGKEQAMVSNSTLKGRLVNQRIEITFSTQ